MSSLFSDISLYIPTSFSAGTPEFIDEVSLQNFVSDLYVQNMNGYKPPKTSRITIQPAFHNIWNGAMKNGSIVSVAPFFSYDTYLNLDKKGKLKCILDLIQKATISLSEEYGWDKSVFENAYQQVLNKNFDFKIDYPSKHSRDRRKKANLIIKKTETLTSVYVNIESPELSTICKLFDKKNQWSYDCVYALARYAKWLSKEKFGIHYRKGELEISYSLDNDHVEMFENGKKVPEINFGKHFMFN